MSAGHYIEYCSKCRKSKDADMANVTPLGIGTLTADFYKCRYCNNDSITRSDSYCGKCGRDLNWDECNE